MLPIRLRPLGGLLFSLFVLSWVQADDLNVLFLGDNGHHRPRDRFQQIQPVFSERHIQFTYTDNITDLNSKNLSQYDAVLLFANIDRIDSPQEKALLDYVAGGGGFVPIHCATYCFRNSKNLVALMGAQFQRHGTGVFRTEIDRPGHQIMRGFGGFSSWDETYVHHLHNVTNRTVLASRVDSEGREPWTWVRTHGDGRVFYTAWGHDHRTWGNAGFQNLLERGIRWAAKDDPATAGNFVLDQPFPVPKMTAARKDVQPFEFIDVGDEIPNYTPGERWGTMGKSFSKMQKPLAPDESLKHVVVPDGFRVELFAAEPDIGGKPLCMTWDERGRLWIAESYDYPNQLQPIGKGRDRIRILEDTDGDWRADRSIVFAEQLSIPTSIMFHRGGVIVQNGTQTLYLKDTDGDDVADERSVLFSGWTLGDTHGGVGNFQYGLDNWVWGMQGYNNSSPKGNGTEPVTFRQGFFRFRPDGTDIEFIRSTNNNTWGLGISEEGIIFGSTANRNPSVYMPIANRYYERVRGWTSSLTLGSIADSHHFQPVTKNVRQMDHHGGYTAGAGHALYTARAYPSEYWNRTAFVNGPTGHLVGTFLLKPDGSDFRSTSPFNLFASDDEWTAPIMSEVGPDGNVWVLDWYNFIVQHNPTPRGFKTGKGNAYETKLRDKKHGRIYRIIYSATATNAPNPRFRLDDTSAQTLVKTLGHPTMLWRKHAQRLLVEQGELDVVPALVELVRNNTVDEIGINVGAIHALWTLHGLGALDGSHPTAQHVAFAAMKHKSAGVRRNALQVLPRMTKATHALLEADVLTDPDAQVRLAAFLSLADLPPTNSSGAAIFAAMQRSQNVQDRWIPDAAISAASAHSEFFLQSVAATDQALSPKLLQSTSVIAEHYARGKPVDSVIQLLNKLPHGVDLNAGAIVAGLARGWPNGVKLALDATADEDLEKLLTKLPSTSQGLLVKLATSWGSKRLEKYAQQVVAAMVKQLDQTGLSTQKRLTAAKQLIEFQPQSAAIVAKLLERISPQTPPDLATGMLRALGGSEASEVGQLIVERFPGLTPQSRATGVLVLLSRPKSTLALLDAMDDGVLQLAELSLDQRQALATHPNQAIRRRARQVLSRGGALPNPDRQKVLTGLLPLTKQSGDSVAGKVVYTKHCAKCHLHSGEGTRIGPDLTGMAIHPKAELLAHVIDPSRNVEGNFRVYSLITTDGRILTGLLASESKVSLELFDAEGKKEVVLREDIDALVASSKSLMPDGFEKQVTPKEIVDLLEFLTKRGKFLPVNISKSATIASDRGMFYRKDATTERMIFPNWKPKSFKGVPFYLTDPRNGTAENVILLHGPNGPVSAKMPKSVQIPCHGPARAIHLLSGVSGWGYPASRDKSVSMIVRLHYVDGQVEEHPLLNGVHFADYIRRVDVPESEFAFQLRNQQLRYLAVHPKRAESIARIQFVKGPDRSAPMVVAVTIESP